MNAKGTERPIHLSGFRRDADGSLTPDRMWLKVTPEGYERLSIDHTTAVAAGSIAGFSDKTSPAKIQRFQSVPGTIDVKFSGTDKSWTFLASAASCEKAGIIVPGINKPNMKGTPIATLSSIALAADTNAMMGDPVDVSGMAVQAKDLREVHTAAVELAGEAKRMFHLLSKHAPHCKDSLDNMARILTERFGIPLDAPGVTKTADRERPAEAGKSAQAPAPAAGGDRGR